MHWRKNNVARELTFPRGVVGIKTVSKIFFSLNTCFFISELALNPWRDNVATETQNFRVLKKQRTAIPKKIEIENSKLDATLVGSPK